MYKQQFVNVKVHFLENKSVEEWIGGMLSGCNYLVFSKILDRTYIYLYEQQKDKNMISMSQNSQ